MGCLLSLYQYKIIHLATFYTLDLKSHNLNAEIGSKDKTKGEKVDIRWLELRSDAANIQGRLPKKCTWQGRTPSLGEHTKLGHAACNCEDRPI